MTSAVQYLQMVLPILNTLIVLGNILNASSVSSVEFALQDVTGGSVNDSTFFVCCLILAASNHRLGTKCGFFDLVPREVQF